MIGTTREIIARAEPSLTFNDSTANIRSEIEERETSAFTVCSFKVLYPEAG
jgi:hypothetical protein